MENFDYPGVKGRLYLVTGASSGIGRACSDILSRLGATVILNGRNEAELEKTMDALAGNGHIVASGNLIELNFKKWLPELAEKAGKPLAGLAHCAGSHTPAP
ncbi:MAG: SDR family NAD(P)-dependent oxidoreductase, partial [Desulfovibrio sp.]|nr:SDR family NAD(P)-dependent oxidoreductase [Desulfovibrio sp.]